VRTRSADSQDRLGQAPSGTSAWQRPTSEGPCEGLSARLGNARTDRGTLDRAFASKCSTQFVIVCAFLTSAVCGRAIRFGRSSALRGETAVVQEWPTEIGDVLILRTSASFTVYVVGRVATVGQQDFSHHQQVQHVTTHAEAVKAARTIVAPRGKIHLFDIDTGEWSEIPR
jgi:hypothetical protein